MKICYKYILAFFLIVTLQSNFIVAQGISNNQLSNLISKNASLKNSFIGISVLDIRNGNEILSYNSNKQFIPASTLKILYTLSAIEAKGKDFRFKTSFYYTGKILFDGTLEGDILIFPSGDPTLGSNRFYKNGIETIFTGITKALNKKGIKCIDGNIILVNQKNSYPINGSWTTEDIGNYYAGGSWDLNMNDNEYKIKFKTGQSINDKTKIIDITPHIPFLKIQNYVKTGKAHTGDNSYIYGLPKSFSKVIKGTLPITKENTYNIKGAIPNPPLTFLRLFYQYLDSHNIFVKEIKFTNKDIENKTYIFDIISPPLIKIVKECNGYSINLYSEALAKLLCLKNDHPNEYLRKEEIYSHFLKYDIDFSTTQIVDGCGLSNNNLISPKTMNLFIKTLINKLNLNIVLEILPHAGEDGYAKNIKNKNLWIKSGSINGVQNYSGIMKSTNNSFYIFSIMSNNNHKNKRKNIKNSILNILNYIQEKL